jgi:muramoyltetrapeptide carboxypeptidase
LKIKPPRLNSGDKIGIIAPAGPVEPNELRPYLDLLKEMNYEIVEAPHLYDRNDYLAGNDDDRLDDLHLMFDNKDIKAIFCARGGYGTLRLLDRIEYELIEKNPKVVVGYSDITALLWAIHLKTGLIVFHGPMIKGLINRENNNLDILLGHISSGGITRLDLSEGVVLRNGNEEGTMLGGNLSLITCLIGTPFMPSFNDKILFIEERDESLYRIDRMLTHLKLSGAFDNLKGLIAGSFIDCGEDTDLNRLLLEVTSDYHIPVISSMNFGHDFVNITLPIGINAGLDTDKKILKYADGYID